MRQLYNTYSWYLVLGLTVFVLPAVFKLDRTQVATYVTTLLFMMSSASALLNNIDSYSDVKISLERLHKLEANLDIENNEEDKTINETEEFQSLRFEDVSYKYNNSSFSLDLPSFSISKNEQVFITGSNGSGKSSFINLFTSLIKPQSGRFFINDNEVNWQEFSNYSNHMAIIYTDHYLFQENYDKLNLSADNSQLRDLIALFNLENVINILNPGNLLKGNLSKGQQKRLFLIFALMEDKPIIVLDEWAAEQDTHNRKAFYTQWLKIINKMGKTVLIITHDDDFLDEAERIIKFNSGKIVSDVSKAKEISART